MYLFQQMHLSSKPTIMKKEFYFHIPQPCHEDWDKMTPYAKGRFCESCTKQVVDFSLMTDHEVLNYFLKNTGKVCGRFANDQLQRPFVEAKQPKKKTWWIAMMMPLLLLVNKINAQKKNNLMTKGKVAVKPLNSNPLILGNVLPKITPVEIAKPKTECAKTVGDTILISSEEQKRIKGTVMNEKGEPIPFATIYAKELVASVAADSAGYFELLTKSIIDSTTIGASAIGYESNEIKIAKPDTDIIIILKQKDISLPAIIVKTNQYSTGKIRLGGAICIVRKVRHKDLFDTAIRKIVKNDFFKTYPNPAPKGSTVYIEIKKADEYSIQLLDVNSKPILVQTFTTVSDKAVTSINIPASLASGTYYIRVINEKMKKQYADKIIVQ